MLFIGIIMGLLLGYETYVINNLKYGFIMFIALLIGVIVPHHYPYDLQGNIHLLLAYIGSFVSILITYMNIMKYNNRTLQNILIFSITTAEKCAEQTPVAAEMRTIMTEPDPAALWWS